MDDCSSLSGSRLIVYFLSQPFRLAYGSEHGLVIVDYVQRICLLNVASPDLYGAQDPYARAPRSPKSRLESSTFRDEQTRSPSIDQVTLCDDSLHPTVYLLTTSPVPLIGINSDFEFEPGENP